MGWLELLLRDVVILPVAGVCAMVWIVRAHWLRRSALRDAPERNVGLGAIDLVMGLSLMFLGMVVAQWVFKRLGFLDKWLGHEGGAVHDQVLSQWSPKQFLYQALVGQIAVHLPVMLYVLWRAGARPGGVTALGLWPLRPSRDGLVALVGLVLAVPLALGLGVMVTIVGESVFGQPPPQIGHEMLRMLQQSELWWVTAGLLTSALAVAPVLEEVVFRGLGQTAMLSVVGPARRWTVVLVVSAAFAMMHATQPWQVLPSLFVLSVLLGWLYERTGSLWPSVFVHAGFNAVNVAVAVSVSG